MLEKARRSDLSSLGKGEVTPAGYMRCDAAFTRSGVFEYVDFFTGKVTKELRHPDDVFAPDSLSTLAMVPITNYHPPEPMNSQTAKYYSCGSTGENIEQEGELVTGKACITDSNLLGLIVAGTDEMSCGYTCDIDPTPGVWEGIKYDVRQKNIRYDHVAVVPQGRAGEECRLRIDSASHTDQRPLAFAIQRKDSAAPQPQPQETTMKIKLQGKEYDVAEDVGLAVQAELASATKATQTAVAQGEEAVKEAKAQADAAKKQADGEKGRADALQAELDNVKKAHADAVDPAKRQADVAARVKLEKDAAKFLGDEKLDGKSDSDIKKACIAKALPSFKLDGVADAGIDTAFGVILEQAKDKNDALNSLRAAGTAPANAGDETKADKAQSDMVQANRNANTEYMAKR